MNSNPATPTAAAGPAVGPVILVVATRKGAFLLKSDRARRAWKLSWPMFPRHTVHHAMLEKWTGGEQDGTPDGPKLHSVLVDPRDARHLYIGMSSGGVFESRDRGASWAPLNAGCLADFLPDKYPEYGHDPHCMRLHPLAPDILYQQNHCGIYRMARPEGRWLRIGENMPKQASDIGFPVLLHPRDPDRARVFPMDGRTVLPLTSPGRNAAGDCTRNAG